MFDLLLGVSRAATWTMQECMHGRRENRAKKRDEVDWRVMAKLYKDRELVSWENFDEKCGRGEVVV